MTLCLAVGACKDTTEGGPSPTRYAWPERFAYRVQFISSMQQQGREVMRYAESRTLHFSERDDESFLVVPDSVLKTTEEPGSPPLFLPPAAGDTVAWYLRLGPLGELRDVVAGCDPAVEACRQTMPSALPLQLRRLIPRLSQWPVPRGSGWVDTVTFDDVARGGGRGILVTSYRMGADTTVRDAGYWVIAWHAVLRSYEARSVVARPVEEDGVTLVHKRSRLPELTSWAGAVATRGADGPIGTGFRGRAWLAGSGFAADFGARR